MVTRFTDDLLANKNTEDFIIRKRAMTVQVILAFGIAFVAIYFTALIMNRLGSQAVFFMTLLIVMGSLAWANIAFATQHRDLVMATEFQNALLASAAQINTRFCLITKSNGTIVYINSGFQNLFPHFLKSDSRTIEKLLANAGAPDDVAKKIETMLAKEQNGHVILSLEDSLGRIAPMMVTIDMLQRPKGYFLFRGRDYIEKRTTIEATPAETATSAQLLSQTLYTLPEALLIADKNEKITYANLALEKWLGYAPGEILGASLKLKDVFYQYTGREVGEIFLNNFEGQMTLQHKNRSEVAVRIKQSLLSEKNETLGISAVMWLAAGDKKPLST